MKSLSTRISFWNQVKLLPNAHGVSLGQEGGGFPVGPTSMGHFTVLLRFTFVPGMVV